MHQLHAPAIGRRTLVQMGGLMGAGCLLGLAGRVPVAALADDATTQAYVPGTYSATVKSKKGYLTVTATFSDETITDVQVDHHDTTRIAQAAIDTAVPQILEHQTLDVDAASGATLTTLSITSALEDCVEQAGGDPEALRGNWEPTKSDASEEIDADLVILGCGGSGLPAAIIAAKSGAHVVVFEKLSYLGGNLMVSGGSLEWIEAPEEARPETTDANRAYFATALERAEELGIAQEEIDRIQAEWDEWYANGHTKVYDSMNWYALSMCLGSKITDMDAQRAHGATNAPLIDWLTNEVGVKLKTPTVGIAGYPWPEATSVEDAAMGEGYVDGMTAYMEDSGITTLDVLFSTPAEELVVEDGKVVGAKGTCADGTTYVVRASKGVIVATGGYACSREYLEELCPSWGFESMDYIPTIDLPSITGDGLTMGRAVGAKVEGTDYVMFAPITNVNNYTADSYVGDSTNMCLVNQEGARFVDETLDRDTITFAVMEQTGQRSYFIASAENAMIDEDGRNAFGEIVEPLIEVGYIYRADTLDEIAELCGIDPDALAKTVETYNACCAGEATDEFGRTQFADTAPILTAPFYATPCGWGTLITDGGLVTGEDDAVLDENDEPIEGLYAIGEVCSQSGIAAMGYGVRIAQRMFPEG